MTGTCLYQSCLNKESKSISVESVEFNRGGGSCAGSVGRYEDEGGDGGNGGDEVDHNRMMMMMMMMMMIVVVVTLISSCLTVDDVVNKNKQK